MRTSLILSALASLAMAAPMAHAAHLTCNNTGNMPDTNLLGFDFTVSVAVSSGGGGGGAGKASTSLIVTLPASPSLVPLEQFVEAGKHSSSCTLSEHGSGMELVMHDVVFSKLEIVSGPSVTGRSGISAQLTLDYASQSVVTAP
jgi:hypothetical protein